MTSTKVVHMTSAHPALDARIFHRECRTLAGAGFHVTIVCPHSEDLTTDSVQIKSVRRRKTRLGRMTRTAWQVYREARKLKADVYHFHDPELIPAGLLLRARGKHVIYDVHEDLPKDVFSKKYLPAWSRPAISGILERLESFVAKRFSAMVTVTPSIAERFRPLNARTIIVHNYPYQREIINDVAERPWGARRQSVAYVGLVSEIRGIREMISAMSLLPKSLTATLEVAGPLATALEQLSNTPGWDRVLYHGVVQAPRAANLLKEVRAGLVLFHPEPNHIEALPQKIFEYMGAGLPVIASDFPLWRRILGDIECGIFVNPLDANAIAGAIEYVLGHPHESEEMGRRGQAAVLERYNWETQVEGLLDLYRGLGKACVA